MPASPASPESGEELLTGELGATEAEGGCAYLEVPGGTRYEVIYPRGWEVNATAATLSDPTGRVVASAGDLITVSGRLAEEMVSICMIGPIFEASEVVSITRR